MLAASSSSRQSVPWRSSVPSARKGAVVGRVTPTGSPTAASDGPRSVKRPLRPCRCSTSATWPSKRMPARPTVACRVTGSAGLAAAPSVGSAAPPAAPLAAPPATPTDTPPAEPAGAPDKRPAAASDTFSGNCR